jgi:hypothetical protein
MEERMIEVLLTDVPGSGPPALGPGRLSDPGAIITSE